MTLRVAICGRNLTDLRRWLSDHPVRMVEARPDVVIAYGGDGALLGAERDFPGVPKCPIRDSRTNPKCPLHAEPAILDMLVGGRLKETRLVKLEASQAGPERTLCGLNDVVISKKVISSAVRYQLWLDGDLYMHQIVGDGLVVATPFGSTGYYRSITHSLFRLGLGLAFNNSTEPIDHLVVPENTIVQVKIIRGPAVVLADNNPVRLALRRGDSVTVRCSAHGATVLGLDAFRCPECERLRAENANPV